MKKMFSVILPVFHQEDHIEYVIKSYTDSLGKLKSPYELLLVINGNDIASLERAKGLAKHYPQIKILFLKDQGWGNAVLAGLKKAQGQLVCYTNSARTRLEDLVAILQFAERNPSIVIKATRMLHISPLRKIGSTLYNIECRLLLHTPVWDVNGTPKVIPRSILKRLDLKSKDDLIDAELIAKTIVLHVPLLEVPILFPPRYGGKSSTNIMSAIKMYLGIWRIKQLIRKHPNFSYNVFLERKRNRLPTKKAKQA